MSRAEKILEKFNRQRAEAIEAGFLYKKAVTYIIAEHPELTWSEIAKAIGCSPAQLRKIKDGTVPNHIIGALLWGLLFELYGDEKRRELFLTDAQRRGGKLLK